MDGVNLAFLVGLLGFGISLIKDIAKNKTENEKHQAEIQAIKEDVEAIKNVLQKRFNILVAIVLIIILASCNLIMTVL